MADGTDEQDANGTTEGSAQDAGDGTADQSAGGNGDAGAAAGKGGDAQDVSALPEWAQKLIRDGRQEAAANRVKGKESGKAEVLDTLAKALGLKNDEKPDPEKLAADLASRDSKLKETRSQLAVLKAAGKVKADPEAVLDSNSTMSRIGKLDPDDEDYESEVSRILAEAVKANPRLGIGTPLGAGGRDMSGSGGDSRSLDSKAREGDLSDEDARKIVRDARKR